METQTEETACGKTQHETLAAMKVTWQAGGDVDFMLC